MNQIQKEIVKALLQLSEKNLITEAVIAKKIRENLKFNGKAKAGLCFQDLETAIFNIEENNDLHYSLHLNSANDLLLKQAEKAEGLGPDARKRRLASEKSMSVLTNGDVKTALSGKSEGSKPYKKRIEKKRMNINKNYDDWE